MVTPVKNQSRCNSCYAFSVTAALESYYLIKYGKKVDLSEQEVLDCSKKNHHCKGGQPSLVLDYVQQNDLAYTKDYGYVGKQEICKILKDQAAGRRLQEVKQDLANINGEQALGGSFYNNVYRPLTDRWGNRINSFVDGFNTGFNGYNPYQPT